MCVEPVLESERPILPPALDLDDYFLSSTQAVFKLGA